MRFEDFGLGVNWWARGLAGLVALAAAVGLHAGTTVRGVVFDDRDGDGLRGAAEPGLAVVGVSDGVSVVFTDQAGGYTLPDARAGREVFVIKPRDWAVPTTAEGLPKFYRRAAEVASGATDFPLRSAPETETFRALAFADTQTDSARDVGYLDKRMAAMADAGGAEGFAFGVVLGDVVNDRPELYGGVNRALARAGVTWWMVNGNHDRDALPAGTSVEEREARATESYRAEYGPDTYAFHHGAAVFVGLNNIRPRAEGGYVGGLREDQFVFLENLLRTTSREEQVVVMTHIPWFYPNPANEPTFRVEDRARLFALLRDRPKVLWLSGHTHYQRHVFHGEADGWRGAHPLHEYNVAAACGSFWTGPLGASGAPESTMWDGTPPGYGELTFSPEGVRTRYRAFGKPAEHQIALELPETKWEGVAWAMVYANVFDGHDGWTVETRADERSWKAMKRVLAWDPGYARRFLAQNRMAEPAATPRLPEPEICHHLWRAYIPADLPAGTSRIEVRATSPAGEVYRESAELRVLPRAAAAE